MNRRPLLAALTAACALAGAVGSTPAFAQSMRPSLDYTSAATIRETCLAWAGERRRAVAIAIYDARGMLVAYAHQDGVSTAVGEVARWKGESSAKFGRATADLAPLDPPANMPAVATVRGGVPIYTPEGTLLGGVGVSGMRSEDDAACGTAGIEAAGLRASGAAAQ